MEYILKNSKKKNFTTISNTFINDPNLSLGAVALGSKLLSKPSNWVINPPALSKELKLGREKVAKLIRELEENSYLYKKPKDIVFAKKGEQKIFYYVSDCKELIREVSSEDNLKNLDSQLPLLEATETKNPDTIIPTSENPTPILTDTEIPTYTNKDTNNIFLEKQEQNKRNTKLSLHEAMDEVLDSSTKFTLLQKAPNITLEEFVSIYEKMKLEFEAGYCSNLNAGLILAATGRWNFRVKSKTSQLEKDCRILQSRVDYYSDYFKIGSCKPEELLLKFQNESIKFNSELLKEYSEKLKKELGI
ncbi:hypothetical protein [Cetobacterium sp.]|uniref:hypothetical protein n=1 Tax=Cetobacterium sp. TaxID=2071632 RepID=UPI003F2B7E36